MAIKARMGIKASSSEGSRVTGLRAGDLRDESILLEAVIGSLYVLFFMGYGIRMNQPRTMLTY
jgi:hypothetical protein